MMGIDIIPEAMTLHESSIVIDGHCDALGRILEGQLRAGDTPWGAPRTAGGAQSIPRLGERSKQGQFDLPRALDGGLTLEVLATIVEPGRQGGGSRQTLQFIDLFYQELEAYCNLAMAVVTADQVLVAKRAGKVALMLSMEGAEGLQGDLGLLRAYYRLGLRCLGLTWNRRNEAADGAWEEGTGGGLTRFGRDLVAECNRLGIVLDVAHLAPCGVEDVLALSEAPVIATHANSHALRQHPRNLTDAQLEAIARKGGLVGVTAVPAFLGDDEYHSRLSVLLDHIDHMVQVMGEDGVGLGMDFDGVGDRRVDGIEEVSKLPNITQGLLERGYSAEAIRKILGDNYLRVFSQVL